MAEKMKSGSYGGCCPTPQNQIAKANTAVPPPKQGSTGSTAGARDLKSGNKG